MRSIHDLGFVVVSALLGLTIPAALGAVMIMLFWSGTPLALPWDLTPVRSHVLSRRR
jgi:hypothetical protein